jgi:hypothetical protein
MIVRLRGEVKHMSEYIMVKSEDDEDKEKKQKQAAAGFGCGIILLLITFLLFPDAIPFDLFQFWFLDIEVGALLKAMFPLFAWGIALSLFMMVLKADTPKQRRLPGGAEAATATWIVGTIISLYAGIFEELVFRWFRFFTAMVGLQILNFLFFGFIGLGIPEAFAVYIACPIANFFTLGYLEAWLFHPAGWFVGAAMLSSNGRFRDGHMYQGIVGWIDAWFVGMIFFYIMFKYGLFAAMIVHFFFDFFLFTMLAMIIFMRERR